MSILHDSLLYSTYKVSLTLESLVCNLYRPLSHALQNPSNQMLIADAGSDMVHGNVKDAITCSSVRCLKARQGTFKVVIRGMP